MDQLIANRFQVQSRLGAGGMGEVYRGMDTQTGQPVAIKALRRDFVTHDPTMIERFRREGEVLRQLNHPNIVAMLDVVDEPDQLCIVMELVPGGTLADLLKTAGPLPVERTLTLALELADALARAHHLQIIHRDIKPENVMLAQDGTTRLTDFGLAKRVGLSTLTDTDAIVGTLTYVSPETLNGQPLDTRTDIWSFGVMLFEMLAGVHPFRGDTLPTTLTAILNAPPTPDLEVLRPDIPEALASLIYTMLEKDPTRRMDSVRRVAVFLEDIRNGKAPDVPASLLANQATDMPAKQHHLPKTATPFIGRQEEIQTLLTDLANPDCRLLSLAGPGGIGKTRLAMEVAAQAQDAFEHGVFAVELAAVHAADDIPEALGRALGFQWSSDEHSDRTAEIEIVDYLRSKQMLLVFDNYEHLLDGVHIIDTILLIAPRIKIIATSREVLNLEWEWVYTVRGMAIPDNTTIDHLVNYSAVQLLNDRARRVQPRFSLRDDHQCAVRICRLVDGMPLGIELAAAWLRVVSCEELVAEISKNLDILTSKSRTGPARHRSLRAVFDHSWSLLSAIEQEVLMKLSVFPAPFRRGAARAVANASLAVLSALVDKSLLRIGGSGWYDLHPLVQQYAADELAQHSAIEQAAHANHAHYYLDFLANHADPISGADAPVALREIELEKENIRTAFLWACREGDNAWVEPATVTMFQYAKYRREHDATFWHTALEQWGGAQDRCYGTLLAVAAVSEPDQQAGATLHRRGLKIVNQFTNQPENAFAMAVLSQSAHLADHEVETGLLTGALHHFQAMQYRWGIMYCHRYLSERAYWKGQPATARDLAQHWLDLALVGGNPYDIVEALQQLAWLYERRGDSDTAFDLVGQAADYVETIGDPVSIAANHNVYGFIEFARGNFIEACRHYHMSLPVFEERGNRERVLSVHNNLGIALIKLEAFDDARFHLETAEALSHVIEKTPWPGPDQRDSLGELEMAIGNLEAAQAHFHYVLEAQVALGNTVLQLFMTNQFARLCARLGDLERSAELVGFATHHPAADSELRTHADLLLDELHAALPDDILNAAIERGKVCQLEDVVAKLLRDFAPE